MQRPGVRVDECVRVEAVGARESGTRRLHRRGQQSHNVTKMLITQDNEAVLGVRSERDKLDGDES